MYIGVFVFKCWTYKNWRMIMFQVVFSVYLCQFLKLIVFGFISSRDLRSVFFFLFCWVLATTVTPCRCIWNLCLFILAVCCMSLIHTHLNESFFFFLNDSQLQHSPKEGILQLGTYSFLFVFLGSVVCSGLVDDLTCGACYLQKQCNIIL